MIFKVDTFFCIILYVQSYKNNYTKTGVLDVIDHCSVYGIHKPHLIVTDKFTHSLLAPQIRQHLLTMCLLEYPDMFLVPGLLSLIKNDHLFGVINISSVPLDTNKESYY